MVLKGFCPKFDQIILFNLIYSNLALSIVETKDKVIKIDHSERDKMKPVTLLIAISAIATSLTFSAATYAQSKDRKPIIPQVTDALIWAQETGKLAGGASFCKVDPDILDDYISRAHAKIASTAADEQDLIVSRVEFNNVKTRESIEIPSVGCEKFLIIFNRENARMD